jgi:hypothetical protein
MNDGSPANDRRGPSPILAAALLLVVAVVGVLGGIVLDRTVLRHDEPRHSWVKIRGLHGPPDHEIRGRVLERIGASLADELDLSESQREEISVVLERHEARLAEEMADSRPRLRQILEETHREMIAILTPEQRERLEEMWMERHGHGPPMFPLHPRDSLERRP